MHALDAAKNPKYGLLNSIYEKFKKLDQTPANWICYLQNPQEFALNVKKPPPYYFTRRFKDFPAKQPEFPTNKVDAHDYLYDYQDAGCTAVGGYSPTSFWVDFSDVKFGGGIFGNGYAQEETMMAEAPDLANAAAFGREFQQSGGVQTSVIVPRQWKKGQKYGDPTPVIIMGANRVAKVVWDLSGDFKKATATFLTAPQRFNMLAMAAPDLRATGETTNSLVTISGLFNTFVAGFHLAASHATDQVIINTGGIGTGVFENDSRVVYVLQRLAAMQVSPKIKLRFWGYSTKATDCEQRFQEILKAVHKEPTSPVVSKVLEIAQKQL